MSATNTHKPMKKVYSAQDVPMTMRLEQVLKEAGIDCVVRNAMLSGGAGEIPVNETWPELWVLADEDYDRARELVLEVSSDPIPQADWTCPQCGEHLEGQFSVCWNCGTGRPQP